MKRTTSILAILAVTLAFSACKKQQLYFQKVERVESNTTSRLNRIMFVDDTTCIIAGGERFLKAEILISRDGGYTWQNDSFPQTGKGMYGVARSANGSLYFCGFDGTLISTNDTGRSWKESRLQNWKFHVAASFVNNNKMVFVSTEAQRAGAIVIADTNQQIVKNTAYEFGINDVQMVNSQVGYIAAYGAILKTTDGADNWNILDVKNDNFNALDCKSTEEVWACGYNGSIQHTTDGGATWTKLRNGNNFTLPEYHLLDILFINATDGYAVGEKGLVIYTKDGGNSWNRFSRFTESALRSITYCPDGTLLVVGDEGVIYRLHP